jgi:toxin-antitoxin system PIN domain toxin
MLLPDVNVLVYAAIRDAPDHARYAAWLDGLVNGPEAYGMSDVVVSGFLRVVTHPRIFREPLRIDEALSFAELVRGRPQCVSISPGPRHWPIFSELCRTSGVRGPLVPDAWFAALAIESGSQWVTTDRDYARFPGLRWRHPLD